mmetsp:Transcript_75817/g.93111  ORF Transcript_75817/g.93111 Transcript_75817/m.93111 type:complete len:213 (+) Transcript_75817:38-676(+)
MFSVFLSLLLSVVYGITAPEWPVYWKGWYNLINTTHPNDLHSTGAWYYDFTKYPTEPGLLRQDIDFGCTGSDGTNNFTGFCRGVFLNNDFYRYDPESGACCLAFPDLPPTNPNWLVNISTQTGEAKYEWTGQDCSTWQFLDVHTYYADLRTGLPVSERGGGTDLTFYNVDVTSNSFDNDVFSIPNMCLKKMCPMDAIQNDPFKPLLHKIFSF